jgi:phosphoglycerate dehydrogenase-like enzyme
MRVAIIDDYQSIALSIADWSVLDGRAELVAFPDHLADEGALVERLADFDAVVVMRERTPLPGRVLERLPRLRLIVTSGSANAALDLAAAARLGITVQGTQGWAGVTATIELTWGLILGMVRQLPREDAAIRAGGWQETIGITLAGKVLGIVGLGNLGSLIPPVARALGMEVVGWSRNLDPARAVELGVTPLDRESFFARSDVVTVHVKMGERSVGYVGPDELALMRPDAYLVNTSRGPIVDELALAAALTEGRLAGAALDVFSTEPLPADHPLRSAPNLVLSPHIGYVTRDSYREYFPQVVEDIDTYLRGEPMRVLA